MDKVGQYVLKKHGGEFREGTFADVIANDERVFNVAPGGLTRSVKFNLGPDQIRAVGLFEVKGYKGKDPKAVYDHGIVFRVTRIDEIHDQIGNTVDVIEASCKSAVDERLEEVEEFAGQTLETITNRADQAMESVEAFSEGATEKVEELFSSVVPDGLGKETEKVFATLGKFESKGLDEIEKLTDKVRAITDKTRELTDLIDQVRPILDLANSVL